MTGNVLPLNEEIRNKIIICIVGKDKTYSFEDYGLTFDSSNETILETLHPNIEETFGVSIKEGSDWLYKVQKAVNSQTIYVVPNSTAGKD